MKPSIVILVIVCSLGLPTAASAQQDGYTFSDHLTGEEVYVNEITLERALFERIVDSPVHLQFMAIALQYLGDSVGCSLFLTKAYTLQNPQITIARAAESAEILCLGIQAAALP